MYEIETRRHEPKNFFAGEFPTLTDSGIAGEDIKEHMPVAKDENGNIIPLKKTEGEMKAENDVIGISAAAALQSEPVVYYVTGEFFAEALEMPDGIETKDIKGALQKITIFLKDGGAVPGKQ